MYARSLHNPLSTMKTAISSSSLVIRYTTQYKCIIPFSKGWSERKARTRVDNEPQTRKTYESASHIPSPANNKPRLTNRPTYAETCTPMCGRMSGVCKNARKRWIATTTGNVTRNRRLDVDSLGTLGGSVFDGFGLDEKERDMGERRYDAETRSVIPSERMIELKRTRHEMNTGIRWDATLLSRCARNDDRNTRTHNSRDTIYLLHLLSSPECHQPIEVAIDLYLGRALQDKGHGLPESQGRSTINP